MYQINKNEKLVRQFLLESRFDDKSMNELYRQFLDTYQHAKILIDEFSSIVESFDCKLVLFHAKSIFDHDIVISTFDQISPVVMTNTDDIRETLNTRNIFNRLDYLLDDNNIEYRYENVDVDDLDKSISNKTDYVIYKVKRVDGVEHREIEYQISAEELQNEISHATQELEFYGKLMRIN